MTQAAIAAEVHQTLDVDTGLTAKVAFDEIVAVDHFADLQDFLVAQLADATILGDLDLFNDLGRVLLADAMDVLERDQNALVWSGYSRRQYGPRTSLLSPIPHGPAFKFLLSRAGFRKREHDALPLICFGARHRQKLSDLDAGLIKGFNSVSSTASIA